MFKYTPNGKTVKNKDYKANENKTIDSVVFTLTRNNSKCGVTTLLITAYQKCY